MIKFWIQHTVVIFFHTVCTPCQWLYLQSHFIVFAYRFPCHLLSYLLFPLTWKWEIRFAHLCFLVYKFGRSFSLVLAYLQTMWYSDVSLDDLIGQKSWLHHAVITSYHLTIDQLTIASAKYQKSRSTYYMVQRFIPPKSSTLPSQAFLHIMTSLGDRFETEEVTSMCPGGKSDWSLQEFFGTYWQTSLTSLTFMNCIKKMIWKRRF